MTVGSLIENLVILPLLERNDKMDIMTNAPIIDLDEKMDGLGYILDLDSHKVYGHRIWMLFKDVCDQSLERMLASLTACRLGLMSFDKLNHAIDNYGDGWDADEALRLMQEKLPNFAKAEASTVKAAD